MIDEQYSSFPAHLVQEKIKEKKYGLVTIYSGEKKSSHKTSLQS